jgi:hypothetical protein
MLGDAAIVSALTALAAYTRFRPLAPRSLWLDDAWVSVGYKAHGLAGLARTTFTSPLFSLVTDLWLKAVGLTSLRAQTFAFVAGIVGPAVVYVVVRSMRLGRAPGFLAATLLLVAPCHLLYSSRVKQYTLEAILSTVMLGVAWRLLAEPDTRHWRIMTVTAIGVSLASIAVAPVVAGAYVSTWVASLRTRRGTKAAAMSTLAYALVVGSWYFAAVRPDSHSSLRAFWQGFGGFWTEDGRLGLLASLHLALEHVAQGFSVLPPNLTIWLLSLAAVVAFVRSIERALLLVVPLAVAVVLSGLRVAPIGSRVDIYLYPTFAILAAFAAQPLLRRTMWFSLAPIVLLGALLVATPFPSYYPQEDLAPLVDRLEAQARPADPVLLYQMGTWAFALYTRWPVRIVRNSYDPVPFSAEVSHRRLVDISDTRPDAVVDPLERLLGVNRLWFIGSHGSVRSIEAIDRTIEREGFVLKSQRGYHRAWLDEFVRKPVTASRA